MKLPIFSKSRDNYDGATILVVGLGNPGEQYEHTRHNIGFMVVRRFMQVLKTSKSRRRYGGRWREGELGSRQVATLLPQTFMNRSGDAVQLAASSKHIQPEDIIVVHDDMDFPFGTVRTRKDGGSGGHRGLDSITRKLGTADYVRVRVGIGRPEDTGTDVRGWVLSPFEQGQEELQPVIDTATACIESIISDGIEAAMNRFNRREE